MESNSEKLRILANWFGGCDEQTRIKTVILRDELIRIADEIELTSRNHANIHPTKNTKNRNKKRNRIIGIILASISIPVLSIIPWICTGDFVHTIILNSLFIGIGIILFFIASICKLIGGAWLWKI